MGRILPGRGWANLLPKDGDMPSPGQDKRSRILDAATEFFAQHPFHKVLLSDVARAAGVGKGTLYLYFENKDELYFAVLFRGFEDLVETLRPQLAAPGDPEEQLRAVVCELATRFQKHSDVVELLKGTVIGCPDTNRWSDLRLELRALIEAVIRRGIEAGRFEDPHPELTARYIPGLVRSACLFQPEGTDAETLVEHALAFVIKALQPTH